MREQRATRFHAHVEGWAVPVRWIETDWDDKIKNPDYSGTVLTAASDVATYGLDDLGLGRGHSIDSNANRPYQIFIAAPARIWNEYLKWPEDNDSVSWAQDGRHAVALDSYYTRIQKSGWSQDIVTAADYEYETTQSGSREKFDIRELNRFVTAYKVDQSLDWYANTRYQAALRNLWGVDSTREVDRVPMSLGFDAGLLGGRNLFATDAEGLGTVSGIHEFSLSHRFKPFTAPEHMVVVYMLCIRLPSVSQGEINPLALSNRARTWDDEVGEFRQLASRPPEPVARRDLTDVTASTTIGLMPSGWRWRNRWNFIGEEIATRDSFPISNALEAEVDIRGMRQADNVNKAFKSQSLQDFIVDVNFQEHVDNSVAPPGASIMTSI